MRVAVERCKDGQRDGDVELNQHFPDDIEETIELECALHAEQ